MRQAKIWIFGIASWLLVVCCASADDWPQFLGPQRNGQSKETGLLKTWPKNGPSVVWKASVGQGFSGPVVSGDRLIIFFRQDGKEVTQCHHAMTGKMLWESGYSCDYQDQYGKGDGPRATPTIAKDLVVTYGADGSLQVLEMATGKQLWLKNTRKLYDVPPNFFGVGSSPLVFGDRVLVNVGGENAGIVAFGLKDGKELWKATADEASYASPILARFGERNYAVFFTRFGVVVLDPINGNVVFRQRWRARYAASVNAATPLVVNDLLFASASYETGALLLQNRGGKFVTIWSNDESMSNHYNTCIVHDGFLYGIHGRQEGRPVLRCVELKTGKVRWSQERFGCASMIFADNSVLALTEAGELVRFATNPNKYEEMARATVFTDPPCRAQIALANGLLYARDSETLRCFRLKE